MNREELHHFATTEAFPDVLKLALSQHMVHQLLTEMGDVYNITTDVALAMVVRQISGMDNDDPHYDFSRKLLKVMREVSIAYEMTLNLATEYEQMLENCDCEICVRRRQFEQSEHN